MDDARATAEAQRNLTEAREYARNGILWHQGQADERPVTPTDLVDDREERGIYNAAEAATIRSLLVATPEEVAEAEAIDALADATHAGQFGGWADEAVS